MQTKGWRHRCAGHTNAHSRGLPPGKAQEQESDSGELYVLEEDGKRAAINQQCNCVPLHTSMRASTQTRTVEAD